MKKLTALILTATLTSAVPALAQTEAQKTVSGTTSAQSDMASQMQVLRKALQDAKTPAEKFDANLNIANMRFEQEIFGEAVYYAGEALKIADADFPNDAERRTSAVVRRSEALRKVGRVEEANALINEDVDRKSQKGDHIWRDTDGGIRHRFTGMVCPDFAGQLPRQEFHNFSQAGLDVGCSYKLISEHVNAVSLYMTRYGGRVPHLDAIKGGGAALLKRLPDSKKIAVEQPAKFTSGSIMPAYYTLVSFGSVQEGEKYTGAWTQVIGNWILKTRVTWAAELGVGFGEQNTKMLFSQNTDKIIANSKTCEAIREPKPGKRVARDDTLSMLMMALLIGDVSAELEKQVESGDNKKGTTAEIPTPPIVMPQEPITTCYATKSSGDEIALGYHPGADRRYTAYSAVVEDTYFVIKEDPALGLISGDKQQYSLKMIKDGVSSVYQVYDAEPHPSLVFEDIVGVLNGKIDALGSVSVDAKGNSNITISSDIMDAEEESK